MILLNDLPKVLIFEHPPLYTEGIGKTLYAFFANWPKEKLGQVYSVNLPTDDSLCNYFYINEATKKFSKDITKSKTHNKGSIYRMISSIAHSELGVIIRSIRYGKFLNNNEELKEWIFSFKPDIIFYGLGESVKENKYIFDLYKYLNCSLVTYISDDYLAKWEKTIFLRKYYKELKRTYDLLISNSKTLVVISECMRDKYAKIYPLDKLFVAQNALNRIANNDEYYLKKKNKNINISYTGNLGLGRWKIIRKIAKEIYKINKKSEEPNIFLYVYSPTYPSKRIIKNISNDFCFYGGNVTGQELDKVRLESDVLLFVESFNKKYKDILETALSTKVPEYLSYGRVVLSVGPEYSWSCKYMEKNKVAVSVSKQNDIKEILLQVGNLILRNNPEVYKLLDKSKLLLDKNHNFAKNADCFMNMMIKSNIR